MDYLPPETAIYSSVSEVGISGFTKQADLAQYGGSDYSNAVRVERGITLDEAFAIAQNDSSIDYFMYLKGGCMVLPLSSDAALDSANDPLSLISENSYTNETDGSVGCGYCRIFYHGDVVFFSKEGKWLGSAPGLADIYSKEESVQRVETTEEVVSVETLDVTEEAEAIEDLDDAEEVVASEDSDIAEEVVASEDSDVAEEVVASEDSDVAEEVVASEDSDVAEEVVASEDSDVAEEVVASEDSDVAEEVVASEDSDVAEEVVQVEELDETEV